MKTINKLFAALITTATLVACSNDDDIQTNRTDAVQILTTVSNGEALTSGNRTSNRTGNTRADAATDPTYTTAAGTLNLYYGSVNATQSSTFTCAAGQWSTAAPLYWQDLVPATDASKYTFFAVAPAPLTDAATGSVATDQSAVAAAGEVSSFEAADLLMARATTDKSGTLTLPLKHLMSQLKVTLATTTDADALTAEELATAALRIDGLQTAYTVDYTAATNEVPAVAIPSGDVANGLAPYVDGTGAAKAFRFIAPAQATKSGSLKLRFTLTIAGVARNYNYTTTADQAFAAGAITQFDITVNRTSVEKINITVKEWETPAALTGTMGIDITNTATSGTVDGINTLSLWNTKDAATKAEYTFNAATSLWSSPTPFYLDDLTEADTFFARHTPTATDAVSALPDVLGNTAAATQKDGGIALELKHLMSKLTVQIARGTHFPEAVDLSGATLTLNGFKKTFDLSDSNVATATGAAAAYTTAIESASLIVVPQTIAVGTQFTATLKNGTTYTATADKAIVLDAAKKQILKLTLSPTETKIALTVTDWAVGETTDLQALNIATTATDGTAANIHAITLWSSANATTKADYTFSTATSQWSSATPFYLENLTDADAFFARHTPTATDAVSALTDVLGNTAAATQKDGGIALEMKHLMSKFNVSLTRGTGFPATIDLSGATLTLNGFKKTLTLSDANLATATGTAAAYTATTDASNAASLIVIPQALATGTEFVVTLKNKATYTAKLKAALTLTAGNIHTLALTLDVSELSIALSVAPWTTSSSAQAIVIDGIGDAATGNTWDGDKYTLLIGTGTGATDLSATYTCAADKKTWSSTAPLYWDSFAQGKSYTFHALATPATTGTPELDYLAASTTVAFGAPILFTGTNTLKHSMSRLTIVLTPGTGYTATDMTAATVALAKGYLKTKTAPKLGTAHTTEAATTALSIDRTSGALNILTLCPQTWVKDADIVTVKMAGGASYTVPAKAAFALTAGNNHTLTITISKSGVSTAFAVTDWGTGTSGSGDGELD